MPDRMLKTLVRSVYDLQKLRIMTGNRITINYKVRMGIDVSKKIDKENDKLFNKIKKEYSRLTDGLLARPKIKDFKGTPLISDWAEFILIESYFDLLKNETQLFNDIEKHLRKDGFYMHWLKDVNGIGRAGAGVLLSTIDIYEATTVAKIWKYAGLDVVHDVDNKGRTNHKQHLVDREYTSKQGEKKIKKSITYNPFLKSKMLAVIGPAFLKTKTDNKYKQAYYGYKNRIQNSPKHKDKTPIHINRMAIRYMAKRFLVDLYLNWREYEGLPITEEYSKRKLGITHHD